MTHEFQPNVDSDARGRLEEKIRSLGIEDDAQVLAMRKLIQSESDRRVEAGVKRFREETLPQHVQKELDAMHSKKPERVLAVKEKALEFSARTGMSYETVSRLLLGDGEPDDVLSALEEDINTVKINYVQEKLKIHGVNPPKAQPVWDGSLTRNDLRRMTPEQISKAMAGGRLDSMLRGGR